MDQSTGATALISHRMLAVGIDAAEPELVRALIKRGQLPTLQRLLEEGVWCRVESPAKIGSGTVWPTFMTGSDPQRHGIYSEWSWEPEEMAVRRYTGRGLTPFWKLAAGEGRSVGVLDVPFAPFQGLREGFEISEWGAHDQLEGRTRAAPSSLAENIPIHPFSEDRFDMAACISGAKMRGILAARLLRERHPELAVIVFTEMHRAAHRSWGDPSVVELMREIDAQIAALIDAAGADAAVLIFSLHGMRPARGLTKILDALLIEHGFARLSGWSSQSWRERLLSLFAAAKRRAPAVLKMLYRKTVPRSAAHRLAQPTMIPQYDWSATRAFSLPTDQHGWIRINLLGREAKGLVTPRDYEQTCSDLEILLRDLQDKDGHSMVQDILRTSTNAQDALSQRLPDLVVHWTDAAPATHPAGKVLKGQHAPDGFVIARGVDVVADAVQAKDLHRLILNSTPHVRTATQVTSELIFDE